ncbi:MAG: hypothetical protein JXA44_02020 [Methanospirillaceae archaeon]|nr:hypothetical protein [Methanospirillaceae archaeon]
MRAEKTDISKEILVSLTTGPKKLNICRLRLCDDFLCLRPEERGDILIGYDAIRHVACQQNNSLDLVFYAPIAIGKNEIDSIRITLWGIEQDRNGTIVFSTDPGWARKWEKVISRACFSWEKKQVRPVVRTDTLPFIDHVTCSNTGLFETEVVHYSQDVLFSAGRKKRLQAVIYSTDNRLLIKIKSDQAEYISIPYSVIMDISTLIAETVYLLFSYPQYISWFLQTVNVLSFSRIPDSFEEYNEIRSGLWQDTWRSRITELSVPVHSERGIIGISDIQIIIDEVYHSPAKYELSVFARKGWDMACYASQRRLESWDTDLYLFGAYLSREYESFQTMEEFETEPKKQEAYMGSRMAYAAILTYIARKSKI